MGGRALVDWLVDAMAVKNRARCCGRCGTPRHVTSGVPVVASAWPAQAAQRDAGSPSALSIDAKVAGNMPPQVRRAADVQHTAALVLEHKHARLLGQRALCATNRRSCSRSASSTATSAKHGRPIRLDCDVKRASMPNSSSPITRRPGSSSAVHSPTAPLPSTVTTPISAIR